jgi:hypothetical protein
MRLSFTAVLGLVGCLALAGGLVARIAATGNG